MSNNGFDDNTRETQEEDMFEDEIPFDDEDENDEGEDLFADDVLEEDYRAEPHEEDFYDEQYIDNEEYQPMSYHERMRAEEQMQNREAEEETENEVEQALQRNERKSWSAADNAVFHTLFNDDENNDEENNDAFNDDDEDENDGRFEDLLNNLREQLTISKKRDRIVKAFKKFFTEQKKDVYMEAIKNVVANNKKSLVVNFSDLSVEPFLLIFLTEEPDAIIEIMEEALRQIVNRYFPNYAGFTLDKDEIIHVRIKNLPAVESIRDLRHSTLNQLIAVRGVITRRTAMFPQLKLVSYDCVKCGERLNPVTVRSASEVAKPSSCPGCAGKNCFVINEAKTLYSNYQKITIQEPPGTVPAGRIPRSKDVILTNDLIDCARPGEEVIVVGVFKQNYDAFLNVKQGFPVFATIIEANYVEKLFDKRNEAITKEDERKLQELARNPYIFEKLVKSIAPSIFGHEDIKRGIALSLFGGVRRVSAEHTTRGDINVLILGDPGKAKSQFLKYIEKTATRAVYTTGKGSSAVGLTAAVKKDAITGEWTLEGGALVLADEGVCMIDEFDKMNDQDRTSIHEAMEQQSISISKAGIVTTLQARCAVIAAANPIKGRYDTSKTFHQNVELSEPILSRFDILFIVRDIVDEKIDENLALFVVNSHFKNHPVQAAIRKTQEQQAAIRELLDERDGKKDDEAYLQNRDPIPQEMLKKYIIVAKRLRPSLALANHEKITQFYSELRTRSEEGSGLTITARHLESIIRMAEASAKMHLRSSVTDSDVNTAISVMLESFISTQKYSVAGSLKRKFKRYLQSPTDDHQLLLHILNEMVKAKISTMFDEDEENDTEISISIKEFKNEVAKNRIFDISTFLDNEELLAKKGFSIRENKIIWTPPQQ
ncbi:hypothetical protein C9374_009213 [Naegleria lovaniensis]|uniref:DNA replication licensing factor MCM2 n=1 Tax=Naegleria lovaniensis TaxID=51637 RepID=A0AA88KEQ1_NAELO|nr:uncharacterized protein C9374_013617 [Naegleria lovaniensis]XP_044544959.1 uncharacterized protein C9374_009213 [Naegleria lovaniensis]KAG2372716.1 hypothetical protein C9374_013617 [Naegleria lovaniensis]KAG2377697.1 hypothetical protein C9374_009213 [Naegleria lovaniensis]